MKKKQYEKPSVEVVELKQQPTLLAGSVNGDVNATMDDTWTGTLCDKNPNGRAA